MNDTTWFWQIVDARGLADVSSDEFVALNELISKAERATTAERERDEALAALRAMLTVMDSGSKPRKLDEALTWRENDEKARAMAVAALSNLGGLDRG